MSDVKSKNPNKYKCCFCKYFKLEGHRWGHCELLNVYVKGNVECCQVAISSFESNSHQSCSTLKTRTKSISVYDQPHEFEHEETALSEFKV